MVPFSRNRAHSQTHRQTHYFIIGIDRLVNQNSFLNQLILEFCHIIRRILHSVSLARILFNTLMHVGMT